MKKQAVALVVDNRWGCVILVPCGKMYTKKIFGTDKKNKKFELLGVLDPLDIEKLFDVQVEKMIEIELTVAQTRAVLHTVEHL